MNVRMRANERGELVQDNALINSLCIYTSIFSRASILVFRTTSSTADIIAKSTLCFADLLLFLLMLLDTCKSNILQITCYKAFLIMNI